MTDKKMIKLLEQFAKDSPLSKDLDIDFSINYKSYNAKDGTKGACYNNIILLSELVRGAEHFLFWARRKKIL